MIETSVLDYVLPEERIADRPASPRDAARLLVVSRTAGILSHRRVRDLTDLLDPGDLVVLNDTKVVRARAAASKVPTGGRVELLFLLRGDAGRDDLPAASRDTAQAGRTCEALARGAGRPGTRLRLEPDGPEVEVLSAAAGTISVRLPDRFDLRAWLEKSGDIPLPLTSCGGGGEDGASGGLRDVSDRLREDRRIGGGPDGGASFHARPPRGA